MFGERRTVHPQANGGLALEVRGVTKRYPLFSRRRDRLNAFLGRTRGLSFKTALEDVSFVAHAGEAVGVIGENGSGKSTLMRMVAGISAPDEGEIRVDEPVAPILELGLGFNPEFTGRENAMFYGSLLGLSEELMRDRLDDVLAFADLGEFIDLPLRTYSSGMTARLAFAVATNVNPSVLVVDEALAVGDGAFQKKCVDRMARFQEEGRTVLFCSHSMYLITSFCRSAVWLHEGRVQRQGRAQDVVEEYQDYLLRRDGPKAANNTREGAMAGAETEIRRGFLDGLRVVDAAGNSPEALAPGAGIDIEVTARTSDRTARFHIGVSVDTTEGRCLLATSTLWGGLPPLVGQDTYAVRLHVPSLPLASGRFSVYAFLLDETGLHIYDQAVLPDAFSVVGAAWTGSLLVLPHEWQLPRSG